MNAQSLAQVIELNQLRPPRIGGIVKGLTMIKPISLQQYVYDLIDKYSEYNPEIRQFDLELHQLPDFVRHEFAAHIMSDNQDYESEANGPDNPAFEKSMFPALMNYLKNSTDKDAEIQFTHAWRDGVTSYMKEKMTDLIEDALCSYNTD